VLIIYSMHRRPEYPAPIKIRLTPKLVRDFGRNDRGNQGNHVGLPPTLGDKLQKRSQKSEIRIQKERGEIKKNVE